MTKSRQSKVALENEKLVIHFGPNTQGKVDVVNIDGLSEFTRVPEPPKKALTSAKE